MTIANHQVLRHVLKLMRGCLLTDIITKKMGWFGHIASHIILQHASFKWKIAKQAQPEKTNNDMDEGNIAESSVLGYVEATR